MYPSLALASCFMYMFDQCFLLFFVNDTATTEIDTYWHTLSLHDALPIWAARARGVHQLVRAVSGEPARRRADARADDDAGDRDRQPQRDQIGAAVDPRCRARCRRQPCASGDRKSTRLNSSH